MCGQPKVVSCEIDVMKIKHEKNCLQLREIEEVCAANSGMLKSAIDENLDESTSQLIFELDKVKFIDSGGLGLLISFHKLMSARKGKCFIVNPSSIVSQVIELTRLHKVFNIIESEIGEDLGSTNSDLTSILKR